MKKGKSITLLSVICAVLAFLTVMTFVPFRIGATKNYNSVIGAIELDYDIAGGTAYTLTLAKDNVKNVEDIDEVLDTLKFRLNSLGYQSYSVKAVKSVDESILDYDVRIEARGKTNEYGSQDTETLSSDIAVVAKYGEVKFFGGAEANPTEEILKDVKVIENSEFLGSSVSGENTVYQVSIVFTKEGYDNLAKLIDENSSYYLKITLGDTELLNGGSAISKDYFNGTTLVITTGSEASARQAALQIKSGGLAYKYDIGEGVDVSSVYGEKVGCISIAVICAVLVASVIALTVLYKGYGLISLLSLLTFVILDSVMLIAVPNITLSIAGVVGILISSLLVVDGMVITVKRIKEEFENGKMFKPSVKNGFRRALTPVLNSGLISAFVGIMVFAFASGAVKCFGITLIIGAVLSLLINLLILKMFAYLIFSANGFKPSFLNLKRESSDGKEEM